MSTILTMEFPSSDEEDENYEVDEQDLADEVEESDEANEKELSEGNGNVSKKKKAKQKKNSKKVENSIKKNIIKEKIEKTYIDINKEFEKLYNHQTNVNKEDFLLQFHKKYPQTGKNYNTTSKLCRHLNKYCSLEDDTYNHININEYKNQLRNNEYNKDLSSIVKQAMDTFYDNNCTFIEKQYMYAGKTYTIKKKIDKTSAYYKKYLKTKDKLNIGGNFSNIDKLIQSIQENKQINTVDKSTEDWERYKKVNAIDEDKLKANQNYFENKFFAENVDRKLYENKIKKNVT
ncbi:conserved protein, unknown function [Hepatocystis sp. ex Piliocolobus tephrosceles]|nr:conserved protein, unknown function [Hepatocystis sp. ex Piliocolobus tephrosceles]